MSFQIGNINQVRSDRSVILNRFFVLKIENLGELQLQYSLIFLLKFCTCFLLKKASSEFIYFVEILSY